MHMMTTSRRVVLAAVLPDLTKKTLASLTYLDNIVVSVTAILDAVICKESGCMEKKEKPLQPRAGCEMNPMRYQAIPS